LRGTPGSALSRRNRAVAGVLAVERRIADSIEQSTQPPVAALLGIPSRYRGPKRALKSAAVGYAVVVLAPVILVLLRRVVGVDR
jgi:hypothetical protein